MREVISTVRSFELIWIPILILFGCASTRSILGTPTIVSDALVDLPPEVTNADEVRRVMHEEYPPVLRDAGIGGRVVLQLSLDEVGQVQRATLEESARDRMLDELAMSLAPIIRFSPAQRGGEAVPVTVTVVLQFIPPPAGRATRGQVRRGGRRIVLPALEPLTPR